MRPLFLMAIESHKILTNEKDPVNCSGLLCHISMQGRKTSDNKEIPDLDHQLSEVGSLSGVVGPAAGHE